MELLRNRNKDFNEYTPTGRVNPAGQHEYVREGFVPSKAYQTDSRGFQLTWRQPIDFMPLVLVGFEESQAVTIALRNIGIEAYSNDLQECSGGRPEWHLQMDFFKAYAQLHPTHVICFPPCQRLSKAGGAHWKKEWHIVEQNEALKRVQSIMDLDCEYIAIENPVGKISTAIRKPDQKINPYQFGHPYTKETCLWLKGFEPIVPTEIVEPIANWVKPGNVRDRKFNRVKEGAGGCTKTRSKTFTGIAEAMASQWFSKYSELTK